MRYLKVSKIEVFARMLGYERGTKLGRLIKVDRKTGKMGNPSYEIVRDIANKFEEINPEWLLTGKGEMLKSGEGPSLLNENTPKYGGELKKEWISKDVFDIVIKSKDEQIKTLEEQLNARCKTLESLMVRQINIMEDFSKGRPSKRGTG